MRTFSEVIETKLREEIRRHPNSRFSKSKIAQYFVHKAVAPATILGQVLYRAALVAKAMGCYSETQLLKTYLYHDPPLHPRRSLDQFNPWTERLKRSIKDQVVYEATALHHGLLASHRKNPHSFGLGMGHYCKCDLCLSEVRKVPRIIMVDQLWLWILDESKLTLFWGFFLWKF
jgi:hypothetical protein